MRLNEPIGLVAGSGIELEPLLDEVVRVRGFDEFPGLSGATVRGHAGKVVEGRCGGVPVVLQCGRLHFYEGLAPGRVTSLVDVMRSLGVGKVLYTNAAGGLASDLRPGDLVAVSSLTTWPCGFWPDRPNTLELDFVLAGCRRSGRYLWVHGPCYETWAEIRAMQSMGMDAVGMSTAPEVARCQELGMQAAAISCITNSCVSEVKLTHESVVETAQSASARLRGLIRGYLEKLGQPPMAAV